MNFCFVNLYLHFVVLSAKLVISIDVKYNFKKSLYEALRTVCFKVMKSKHSVFNGATFEVEAWNL